MGVRDRVGSNDDQFRVNARYLGPGPPPMGWDEVPPPSPGRSPPPPLMGDGGPRPDPPRVFFCLLFPPPKTEKLLMEDINHPLSDRGVRPLQGVFWVL